jgi:hypothetical protein
MWFTKKVASDSSDGFPPVLVLILCRIPLMLHLFQIPMLNDLDES